MFARARSRVCANGANVVATTCLVHHGSQLLPRRRCWVVVEPHQPPQPPGPPPSGSSSPPAAHSTSARTARSLARTHGNKSAMSLRARAPVVHPATPQLVPRGALGESVEGRFDTAGAAGALQRGSGTPQRKAVVHHWHCTDSGCKIRRSGHCVEGNLMGAGSGPGGDGKICRFPLENKRLVDKRLGWRFPGLAAWLAPGRQAALFVRMLPRASSALDKTKPAHPRTRTNPLGRTHDGRSRRGRKDSNRLPCGFRPRAAATARRPPSSGGLAGSAGPRIRSAPPPTPLSAGLCTAATAIHAHAHASARTPVPGTHAAERARKKKRGEERWEVGKGIVLDR